MHEVLRDSTMTMLPPTAGCVTTLQIHCQQLGHSMRNGSVVESVAREGQALRQLTINSLARLISLPAEVGDLQQLGCLTIQDCGSIEALPDTLEELHALQVLTIDSCQSLQSLPEGFGKLQALEYLTIRGCHSL
ncbi:unnamed protein product [Calypogeia fissa]